MIYISSSSVRASRIGEAVQTLAQNGFTHIELSGGTDYYPDFERDLIDLQQRYNLSYLCHNYFPPPVEPFVLNLASADAQIRQRSLEHLRGAIALSQRLAARRFGFHAGFFVDIDAAEIGRPITAVPLADREAALERFCSAVAELRSCAGGLELYVENNVLSAANYRSYGERQPFMLCSAADYEELAPRIDCKLLLDVAHLKVSSASLGLDFATQLASLIGQSDYLHISDNNGQSDSNDALGLDLRAELKKHRLVDKTITLEVYAEMALIKDSYQQLRDLIHG